MRFQFPAVLYHCYKPAPAQMQKAGICFQIPAYKTLFCSVMKMLAEPFFFLLRIAIVYPRHQ